jgi:hypothetical protein
MIQFEYGTLEPKIEQESKQEGWRFANIPLKQINTHLELHVEFEEPQTAEWPTIGDALRHLGIEGWEMCGVMPDPEYPTFYFKKVSEIKY